MWQKYFKVVKVVPGKIVVPKVGEIDFSKENLSVDFVKNLCDSNFPYIEATEEGKVMFYGKNLKTEKASKTETKPKNNSD